MEKGKVCGGGCGNCCGGSNECSYGSHGMHSVLRLFAVLLVMILIFNLGMQVGELRTLYSNRGFNEMRFEKNYRSMPMMQYEKEAPAAVPAEDSAQ
jgi:hypothetical protein